MSKEDDFLKSEKNGKGHILRNLLSSTTVLLKGLNYFPPAQQHHNFLHKIISPELRSCSICSESGTTLCPLTLQEMEILTKFVLSQEQISLILQTEDHPAIFCCKICSSAILSLAKLSTQIENITMSLRAVISSRNGLFNKFRRDDSAKISELSHETVSAKFSNIGDDHDDQQLTGCVEVEEEFCVKDEPTSDDLIPTASSAARPVQKTIKPFPCPKCDKSFISEKTLESHKRTIHEWNPYKKKCTLCPQEFAYFHQLQKHMRKCHTVPILTSSSQEASHSCGVCAKAFSTPTHKMHHVELFHFSDKTSCPYGCVVQFGSEEEWVTHLEGCDSPKMNAESASTCRFCQAVFRTPLLQIEHHLRVHSYKTYSCSKCGQKCTRQSLLRDHRCTG